MESRVDCQLGSDLLPWEREYFSRWFTAFPQRSTGADTLWLVARDWRAALKQLPRRPLRVFVSVLALPPKTGWFGLLRAWNPRPDLNVTLVTHSSFASRYYREMEKVPDARLVEVPLPGLLEEAAPRPKAFTVGCFSGLASDANIGLLTSVVHYVFERNPSIRFRVFGTGKLDKHLDRVAKDLGIGSVFTRENALPQGIDVLLKVDLKAEHFVPLLWCAARGIPAVVADFPGLDRLVIDGHEGFTVPMNETKPMGELLLRMAQNPSLSESLGIRWRESLAKRFPLDKSTEAIQRLFSVTLAKTPARAA
ncbi:glycosyltransferase [bacterium]|nr:glycosyltransferase [bacterium]